MITGKNTNQHERQDETTKRAYCMAQRPFSIGAQPKDGLVEVEDFDGKKHVEEIGRDAWLKNSRPCCGGTYDQLRIGSEERNEFVIGCKEPCHEETWAAHSPENDFEEPAARLGDVYKLIAWLNEKGE